VRAVLEEKRHRHVEQRDRALAIAEEIRAESSYNLHPDASTKAKGVRTGEVLGEADWTVDAQHHQEEVDALSE